MDPGCHDDWSHRICAEFDAGCEQTKIGLLTKACEPCAATHQLVSPAVKSRAVDAPYRRAVAPKRRGSCRAAVARAPPLSSSAIYLPASGLIARLHSPVGHRWSRASSARPYAS